MVIVAIIVLIAGTAIINAILKSRSEKREDDFYKEFIGVAGIIEKCPGILSKEVVKSSIKFKPSSETDNLLVYSKKGLSGFDTIIYKTTFEVKENQVWIVFENGYATKIFIGGDSVNRFNIRIR